MNFRWLKLYLPRGLYGRAAMILILPVVTLQLVVSFVFIQRHFEDVTEQMTRTVSRELVLLIERFEDGKEAGSEFAKLSDALEYKVRLGEVAPPKDERRWFDFSGLVVIRTLEEFVPSLRGVELPDNKIIRVFAATPNGVAVFEFDRLRVSATNPHQLLVNMVFFGGLMTLIAYLYLRNQLRPITRLAAAAEAFGRGRHVAYTPGGAVEVRSAGNAFLDMRARIERQIEQRTMMLSGVSHDLRTPLTRLKLGLSLLDSDDAEPLERDVEDMQRLLDEFLSFARGAHEGEPELIDPILLVRGAVEDGARGGTNVTLGSVEGEGEVPLRAVGIKRALENLIGNGVRYGNSVRVSVRMSDKSLRIRVEDDGPGIPAEARSEAIKPFARLDPSRNQNKGTGVGLGLSIAADVARAHGGVLRLGESEDMGGLCADIVIAR